MCSKSHQHRISSAGLQCHTSVMTSASLRPSIMSRISSASGMNMPVPMTLQSSRMRDHNPSAAHTLARVTCTQDATRVIVRNKSFKGFQSRY
jgi:hypothetical protein